MKKDDQRPDDSLQQMDGRYYAEGPPRTLAEIFGIWFTPPHIVAALRPPAPPSVILCNPPFGHSPIDQDQAPQGSGA